MSYDPKITAETTQTTSYQTVSSQSAPKTVPLYPDSAPQGPKLVPPELPPDNVIKFPNSNPSFLARFFAPFFSFVAGIGVVAVATGPRLDPVQKPFEEMMSNQGLYFGPPKWKPTEQQKWQFHLETKLREPINAGVLALAFVIAEQNKDEDNLAEEIYRQLKVAYGNDIPDATLKSMASLAVGAFSNGIVIKNYDGKPHAVLMSSATEDPNTSSDKTVGTGKKKRKKTAAKIKAELLELANSLKISISALISKLDHLKSITNSKIANERSKFTTGKTPDRTLILKYESLLSALMDIDVLLREYVRGDDYLTKHYSETTLLGKPVKDLIRSILDRLNDESLFDKSEVSTYILDIQNLQTDLLRYIEIEKSINTNP